MAVLDYGIGNLRSAERALVHVGAAARLVTDPADVAGAAGVVLPGVGAFGPCAAALRRTGLDEAALGAIEAGVPFLGICVGFQLLYEGSEEAPGEAGLGVLAGRVRRLPARVKIPQMQWNALRSVRPSSMLAGLGDEPWVYFVHSYAPDVGPETVATCEYGGTLGAAAEAGTVWGTQFHPEKSGAPGLAILSNFVARCAGTGAR
ncbi:MAG: imidazole glycerol phosphate synthase subunit HisH [Acidimicrobiales bacterium]